MKPGRPAPFEQPPAPSLAELLELGPPHRQLALRQRIKALLDVLGRPGGDGSSDDLAGALHQVLDGAGPDLIWLAVAVLTARLPESSTVLRVGRAARLDGASTALGAELQHVLWPAKTCIPVEIVTDTVLVDIDHTARTSLSTGIQRVARETTRRWRRDHDVVLIGWTDDYTALRRLTVPEVDRALATPDDTVDPPADATGGVIVPWKCTLLIPELAAEPARSSRVQALAESSGSTTGSIGFDCVPVMAAETSVEGMSSAFARYLSAAAHLDRIAAISEAAALEYRGWRTMLAGAGLTGPDIEAIALPVEGRVPDEDAVREAHAILHLGPPRIVLAVGSHEPRKNHLALLHAAEVLWKEGLSFSLTFVGGNSWKSGRFTERLRSLQLADWPVQAIRALPDDTLWAAYRLAWCTVFPSLYEGFGLPVAESLASGTPVITSNFGSMREIAATGGALLVDPRDDVELTDALRTLLLDGDLRERLAGEALNMKARTWDDYAAETWRYLVGTHAADEATS